MLKFVTGVLIDSIECIIFMLIIAILLIVGLRLIWNDERRKKWRKKKKRLK